MKLYYYQDKAKQKKLNREGRDYTPAYLPVMFRNLGFTGECLGPEELRNGVLLGSDVLVLGSDALPEDAAELVRRSGALVLSLGGTAPFLPKTRPVLNRQDVYAIAGYFRFADSEEPLPVLDAFGTCDGGEVLGWIEDEDKNRYPALVCKDARTFHFTFDLCATIQYAADGRPTYDPTPSFEFGRIPDGTVVPPDYDYTIAFSDSYLRFLRNLLHKAGIPSLYELPDLDGEPADLLVFFGGDDDAGSRENDLKASDYMFEHGFPYHFNLMPRTDGTFVISKEDFDTIRRRGQETALHYDFTHFPYSAEGYKIQNEMYERAFGMPTDANVNHCLVQCGPARERYRLSHEAGSLSDNNRFQTQPDPNDINAFNVTGFSTGSAFPRFVIDDAAHGNEPIDFIEIPNSFYEPRLHTEDPGERKKLEKYLLDGFRYARTLQLFTHPHYISGEFGDATPAHRALEYAKAFLDASGRKVVYTAPNALGDFWRARTKVQISANADGCTVENPTERNMFVYLPSGKTLKAGQTIWRKTIAGKECWICLAKPGTTRIQYE